MYEYVTTVAPCASRSSASSASVQKFPDLRSHHGNGISDLPFACRFKRHIGDHLSVQVDRLAGVGLTDRFSTELCSAPVRGCIRRGAAML